MWERQRYRSEVGFWDIMYYILWKIISISEAGFLLFIDD